MRLVITKQAIKTVNAIYNLRRPLNLCRDFLYELAEFFITVRLNHDFFLNKDFKDTERLFRFVLNGITRVIIEIRS